jgi:hypothetical protein
MQLDFSDSKLSISMEKYVNDVCNNISNINKNNKIRSPANANLFKINNASKLLNDNDKKYFHSTVAKLLYLGKRIRPDILTTISFLARRVNSPTVEDFKKLVHLLCYINNTKNDKLTLEFEHKLLFYIDAAYAVHQDLRSHGGCNGSTGKGSFYGSSVTLKSIVKSAYEAEIVSLSNFLSYVIGIKNFMYDLQYKVPVVVYQDNMAVISTVSTGQSNSMRSKHINIRYAWIKDQIKNKIIEVKYCPTEEMIADTLTKPLQGEQFLQLKGKLLNLKI